MAAQTSIVGLQFVTQDGQYIDYNTSIRDALYLLNALLTAAKQMKLEQHVGLV